MNICLSKEHFGFGLDEILKVGFSLLVSCIPRKIMSRSINTKFAPPAQTYIDNFHADIVTEVCKTVSEQDVVVIGMFLNPHVKRAQRALNAHKIQFVYSQL